MTALTFATRAYGEAAMLGDNSVGMITESAWNGRLPAMWISFLPAGPLGARMQTAKPARDRLTARRALAHAVAGWFEAAGEPDQAAAIRASFDHMVEAGLW